MAIPIAKITVIVGAGVVGTILSKEGNLSYFTDFCSGAFKIVTKHLRQDNSRSESSGKPQTDSLLTQVNNLRQELQSLASSRSVTIVTGSRSGPGAYSVTAVVVVGVLGYGYIRWKGLKLSDMMFVTRRSLSDATSKVAKQLDSVSSSVASTKGHLSSRIDRVDCTLNDCIELGITTKDEVSQLHGDLSGFHVEVESVQRAVQTLESKLGRIEEAQDLTALGVCKLVKFTQTMQLGGKTESIQAAAPSTSRPALEPPDNIAVTWSTASSSSQQALGLPPTSPVTRMGSLPPLAPEPLSPSTSAETPKVLRTATTISISGLKELQEVSNGIAAWRSGLTTQTPSDVSSGTPFVQEPASTLSSSRSGWKFPSISLLTRTRSSSS